MPRCRPALCALISGLTMAAGFTFRNRIPKSVTNDTRTPDASACSHRPRGMKRKTSVMKMRAKKPSTSRMPRDSADSVGTTYSVE